MKIGIISGSIREKRRSQKVAQWVLEHAEQHGQAQWEILDLRAFDLPLLTSPTHPMMAKKNYDDEAVQAWSDAVDACDGYIFVTPEYNHSMPGGFKNAVDLLGPEWVGKAVAFVGYGSVGGVRAIEHWRASLANFSMRALRTEVNLSTFTDFDDDEFAPAEQHIEQVNSLLEDLLQALSDQ